MCMLLLSLSWGCSKIEGLGGTYLAAFYKFEEINGERKNAQGDFFHLTEVNPPISTLAGKHDLGAHLVAATTHYFKADPSSYYQIDTNDFSISLWLKRDSLVAQDRGVIAQENRTTNGAGIDLLIDANHFVKFHLRDTVDTTSVTLNSSPTTINDNDFHHLMVTVDRDDQAILYIDGTQVASADITGEQSSLRDNNYFLVGALGAGGDTIVAGSTFDGVIDTLTIWNIALSKTYNDFLYNNGLGQSEH